MIDSVGPSRLNTAVHNVYNVGPAKTGLHEVTLKSRIRRRDHMHVAVYLSCKWDIFCHLCLQEVKGNHLLILLAMKMLFLVCFLNFHPVSLITRHDFLLELIIFVWLNEELVQIILSYLWNLKVKIHVCMEKWCCIDLKD